MKESLFLNTQEHNLDNISYLKEGIKPIVSCVENNNNQADNIHGLPNTKFVNLYGDNVLMEKEGYIKESKESYVISPIGNFNLSSNEFADCTGTVVVGSRIYDNENIAFMSHQNPYHFLKHDKDVFIKDFKERLKEIKNQCEKNTIDVIIFGGRFAKVKYQGVDVDKDLFIKEYINSIKLLSEQINEMFGFYPNVIVGPKLSPSIEAVTFDTKNRRLYLTREENEEQDFIESYNAKDIDIISKNWKPGQWGLPI